MIPILPNPLPVEVPNNQGGASLATIRTMPFGGYDVYPGILYDTVTWPQASPTPQTPLPFFRTGNADPSLSNVPSTGQLPGGQYFDGRRWFISPLVTTAVGNVVLTAAGLAADLDNIFLASRSTFSFSNPKTQKPRGPIKLNMLGSPGGVIPVFGGNNTPGAAAGAVIQAARNSESAGYPTTTVLFPSETLTFSITAGVQTALTTAGIPLCVMLYGYQYVAGG